MKQQLELVDLAKKLHNDRFNKHDFIADTAALHITPLGLLALQEPDKDVLTKYNINPHMHKQIARELDIPKKFYDRMWRDHKDLLGHDITALFRREPSRRMIRTLDGTARALVSDKFRIDMDNYDVANAALPILQDVPGMQVLSCGVTDTRMYIKAQFPRLRANVGVGDEVTAGVVISNSEVGEGSLRIEALIYRLVCTNGMIAGELLRKFHVGAKHGVDDATFEVLSQATRDKTAEATRAVINDVVKAATDATKFEARVAKLRDTTEQRIDGDVPKAIEVLGNKLNLTQDEQSSVLSRLIEGQDGLTRWGLANAVTRAASDVEDYDRATELERAGGNVITLSQRDWTEVAVAA